MKLLLLITALVSFNVFSADVCSYEDTQYFSEDVEAGKHTLIKESLDHKNFSFLEKSMIHMMISTQSVQASHSIHQSLMDFGDYYGEDSTETGGNAGTIEYYKVESKTIILVHYWPGDNEVGAFFELKNGRPVMIAAIGDGEIVCL